MRSARIGAWARIVRRAGPFRVCVVSGVVSCRRRRSSHVLHRRGRGSRSRIVFPSAEAVGADGGELPAGISPVSRYFAVRPAVRSVWGVQCRTKPLSAPKAGPEGRIAWISGCLTRSFDPPGIGCSEWLSNRNTNEKRVSACGRTPSFSNKARADYSVSTTSTSVNTQSKRSLAHCASIWRICD